MTKTKKRVWFWTGIIALLVTVTLVLFFCIGLVGNWVINEATEELAKPHVSEFSYFSDDFVSRCRFRGLYLPTSAEIVRGQNISRFQEGTYCVTFRISAEHERCLLPEEENFYKRSISPYDEIPDDGVTYAWSLSFGDYGDKLYLSDATADGYVYCYVEFSV